MELNQLEYYHVLCKYGSYTKASQELHVSQPAISMAIKKLEDEFGGELINRNTKLFTLTPKGEVLRSWAVKIHNDVESAFRDMDAFSLRQREIIRLGLPFPLCPELLEEGVPRFYSEHTGVALHLLQEGHTGIIAGLTNRNIDMGIICKDMLTPALDFRPYKRLEYYACLPPDFSPDGAEFLTPEMLKDEPMIIPRIANTISTAIREYFVPYDFQPNFTFVDIFPADIWQLTKQGKGVSFMPRGSGRERCVPLSPPLYSDLVVAWLKKEPLTKNKKELIDFIGELHSDAE